jgi:hypothetical protein
MSLCPECEMDVERDGHLLDCATNWAAHAQRLEAENERLREALTRATAWIRGFSEIDDLECAEEQGRVLALAAAALAKEGA